MKVEQVSHCDSSRRAEGETLMRFQLFADNHVQCICFSAEELKDLSVDSESRAGINWQGNVTWVLYHKFETRSPVDLTFLPFDSQVCTIEVFNNLMSGLG